MGAKQSNGRVSKDEKERRKDVQKHIIHQRKSEISAVENHVVSQVQDINVLKEVIQATTYAQNQLDRGGKPFNKGDLVAIIVALDNKQVSNIDKLNSYRIEDLNALIRCIVYDTKNFVPSSNNMIRNEVQQQNNIKSSSSALVITNNKVLPPLPPKPEKKEENNMLRLTYEAPPVYALVRR
jgi:hypothetical protein